MAQRCRYSFRGGHQRCRPGGCLHDAEGVAKNDGLGVVYIANLYFNREHVPSCVCTCVLLKILLREKTAEITRNSLRESCMVQPKSD